MKNRLWILGGWFNSFEAPPRDVWSSPDGKHWTLVTKAAPWRHSDLAMTIAFKNRMWMMGGWYNGRLPGHSASNAVWTSKDGAEWIQATPNAAWSPRIAAALVEFHGRMCILGGTEDYYFGDERSLKNDVWCSEDGRKWTLVTANAGWAPRAYHQAVVHQERSGSSVAETMCLAIKRSTMCGPRRTAPIGLKCRPAPRGLRGSGSPARSIAGECGCLADGRAPRKQTGAMSGSPAMGRNGTGWSPTPSGRHGTSTLPFVFQDRLWIAGGHAKPLSNEVWSLRVPPEFFASQQ